MTNKELKVGDKVWVYTAHLNRASSFTVASVKKSKTLVTVVADVPDCGVYKAYQIIMYGHASSSLLSGFDRKWSHKDVCYTCDYSLNEEKTKMYNCDQRYKDAGRALLNLAEYLK